MKKIVLLCFLLLLSSLLFAGEEQDVTSLNRLPNIEKNIIDFSVYSPANTLSPSIFFRTGIILTDKFKLGISGNIFNILDYYNDQNNVNFASNGSGGADYKNQEILNKGYKWSQIDNYLNLYLGWKFKENIQFTYMAGFGSDWDDVSETLGKKNFKFNADGSLNSVNPGVDDLLQKNKSNKGYCYINLGFGANLLKDLFYTELINEVNLSTLFRIKFGSGADSSFIPLVDTGLGTTFDGNNSNFTQTNTYYKNGKVGEISYKVEDEEKFKYIGLYNETNASVTLNLHSVSLPLSSLNSFKFTPGIGFNIDMPFYYFSEDNKKFSFNDNVLGYFTGDIRNIKTIYNINYLMKIGGKVPLTLEIKPISSVQIKFDYIFNVLASLSSYGARYSENKTVNGVDGSFKDPIVSVNNANLDFTHNINARFKYEFPKYVKLSVGSNYTISHSLYSNNFEIKNNSREFSNGTVGQANYDIQKASNYNSSTYPYVNPLTVSKLNQSISPTLEVEIDLIKDIATMTMTWSPLIQWSNPGNANLADTNLLNLANWKILNVVKFDNAKLDSTNYTTPRRVDTYDKIVILHTNDHHGQIFPYDIYPSKEVGGVFARASLIKDMKKKYKNVLVLDAGDINTGSPESNFFNGMPDIEAYNYMNYDAVTLGNHEFDFDNKILLEQMRRANFPFLSANVKTKDGKYLAKPYIIKTIGNTKVAIFGLTTTETKYIGSKDYIKDIVFEDEVQVAKKLVPELRKQADIVILLGHLGLYDTDDKGSRRVAKEVSGIDLIIDGHTHSEMSKPFYQNGTPIVQATKWGIVMGKAELTIKNGKLANISWEPVPVNVTEVFVNEKGDKIEKTIGTKYEPDYRLALNMKKYRVAVDKILSEVIGNAENNMMVAEVRKQETEIGNLVADSMQDFAKKYEVDFSFQNSGGIRADINSGSITMKNIYNTLPFDNTVVILTMTGEELQKMFDYIATIRPSDGAFPQVSKELSFTINYDTGKCENILINGQPLDKNRTYKIATNSYLADGGNNYTMFKNALEKYDTSIFQRDVLIQYIKKMKTVSPKIEGRIKKVGGGRAMINVNVTKKVA